jgi:hypothetical protein
MPISEISKRIRIDIDRDVYRVLALKAQGFETPNQTLRRILGLSMEEEK